MKFLCDQCKAKYQIADEKVVGKTVRMKCRKCGHMIEVRAAVVESAEGAATSPDVSSTATTDAAAHATSHAAGGMATSLARVPAPPRASRDNLVAVSRDALSGAFNSSMSDEPSSRSLGLSPADEWYVAINGVPVGPVRIGELKRKASGGAVTEESLCWQEGFEEWRPVRSVPELAQMVREVAATGRVSLSHAPAATPTPAASTERRSSIPPRAPSRPNVPRATPAPVAAALVPAPTSSFASGASGAAFASGGARSNVLPFAAGASASRMATAERLHPEDDETVVGPNPSNPPSVARAAAEKAPVPAAALAPSPSKAPSFAPDPFAAAAPAPLPAAAASPAASPFTVSIGSVGANGANGATGFGAPGSLDPTTARSQEIAAAAPFGAPSPVYIQAPAPQRMSPAAMAMIAMAGLFGVTAAIMLFLPKAAPVAPVTVVVAPSGSVAPTSTVSPGDIPPVDSSAPDPSTVASTSPAGKNPTASQGAGVSSGKAAAGASGASSASSGKAVDPSIAALLSGGSSNGPTSAGGSGGGNGSGTLTQEQIEAVVRSRSASVKRTCWERSGSGKSNNTTVALTIAGNGTVSSANATGNDPAMSSCIEKAVRGWIFPPSGGSTPVSVPFHFVAQ